VDREGEYKMDVIKTVSIESLILEIGDERVLLDTDIAKLYGVETKRINEAVKNNIDRFPKGYIFEIDKKTKLQLVENFDRFDKLKHSTALPKAFSEKGLYMLATILTTKQAVQTTLNIIETFSKIRELSRNINNLMRCSDEMIQKELTSKSNAILEQIIDVESDVLEDGGEVIETTTKFEFSLGFAKVSRSIKKIKK
jgi:phage regulator Rha-like protein